jgi:hypothetical protein
MPATVFVAESLENYADSLPSGSVNQAAILRQAAAIYRRFTESRMVRVQAEEEDVNPAIPQPAGGEWVKVRQEQGFWVSSPLQGC